MKLLMMPLVILLIVALLGMMGLGAGVSTFSNQNMYDNGNVSGGGYYDANGHQLTDENWTIVGESGTLWPPGMPDSNPNETDWLWTNSTGTYHAYNTNLGYNNNIATAGGFSLSSSLGIIAIVAVIMALATIAGIRIVGSGISEESVSAILKGSAFITLWLMLSALAMGLITSIAPGGLPIGPIFYFGLTLVYTLGIINQIGHPGDD